MINSAFFFCLQIRIVSRRMSTANMGCLQSRPCSVGVISAVCIRVFRPQLTLFATMWHSQSLQGYCCNSNSCAWANKGMHLVSFPGLLHVVAFHQYTPSVSSCSHRYSLREMFASMTCVAVSHCSSMLFADTNYFPVNVHCPLQRCAPRFVT